jgi:hypothetical protein
VSINIIVFLVSAKWTAVNPCDQIIWPSGILFWTGIAISQIKHVMINQKKKTILSSFFKRLLH